MIHLIAIRHAKPLSEGFADETLRPLSPEGIALQKKITRKIQQEGYRPTSIYSSPLLRAEQTAAIIADVFELEYQVEPALGYAFDAESLLHLIESTEAGATVCFVGHAPTLAGFIDSLTGKSALPAGLPTSGVAIVRFAQNIQYGSGELIGIYHPKEN